jgi:ABC-type sugar transport system ATPase subunit
MRSSLPPEGAEFAPRGGPSALTNAPLVRLAGIRKRYGAVEALRGVDLDVDAGEVVAICGDNGAGKSSLIRVISGAHEPDDGDIEIEGRPVRFGSPQGALEAGVATIYQDLALATRQPIWQNIFIGAELTRSPIPGVIVLDKTRMRAQSRGYLAKLNVTIEDTNRAVDTLSGGQRQAVAIARALRWNARLVVMDEPTAALGVAESRQVLDLIRELHRAGTTVILVSHNMAEVVEVATRVAVLKSGRKIADRAVDALSADDLAHLVMTGQLPSGASLS